MKPETDTIETGQTIPKPPDIWDQRYVFFEIDPTQMDREHQLRRKNANALYEHFIGFWDHDPAVRPHRIRHKDFDTDLEKLTPLQTLVQTKVQSASPDGDQKQIPRESSSTYTALGANIVIVDILNRLKNQIPENFPIFCKAFFESEIFIWGETVATKIEGYSLYDAYKHKKIAPQDFLRFLMTSWLIDNYQVHKIETSLLVQAAVAMNQNPPRPEYPTLNRESIISACVAYSTQRNGNTGSVFKDKPTSNAEKEAQKTVNIVLDEISQKKTDLLKTLTNPKDKNYIALFDQINSYSESTEAGVLILDILGLLSPVNFTQNYRRIQYLINNPEEISRWVPDITEEKQTKIISFYEFAIHFMTTYSNMEGTGVSKPISHVDDFLVKPPKKDLDRKDQPKIPVDWEGIFTTARDIRTQYDLLKQNTKKVTGLEVNAIDWGIFKPPTEAEIIFNDPNFCSQQTIRLYWQDETSGESLELIAEINSRKGEIKWNILEDPTREGQEVAIQIGKIHRQLLNIISKNSAEQTNHLSLKPKPPIVIVGEKSATRGKMPTSHGDDRDEVYNRRRNKVNGRTDATVEPACKPIKPERERGWVPITFPIDPKVFNKIIDVVPPDQREFVLKKIDEINKAQFGDIRILFPWLHLPLQKRRLKFNHWRIFMEEVQDKRGYTVGYEIYSIVHRQDDTYS